MRKHRLAPLWIALVFLLFAAAVVYFSGVYFFTTHFPFQTSFMGMDVSRQTQDVIGERMAAESAARYLTILEQGGASETLHLATDLGYRRSVTVPEGGWITEEDAWSWPGSLFEATELAAEESFTYSTDKLNAAIAELDALDPSNVTEPQDAYIQWEDGVCFIVPEVNGNKLSLEKVTAAVTAAIEQERDTVDLEAEGCYYRPEIRSDNEDLVNYVNRYKAINFQTVSIDMTGTVIELSSDDVLSFYNDGTAESGLSQDKVYGYVEELKAQYDTYERQRPFVNHYGDEIQVGTWADTYGFKMDLDATKALFMETLESQESAVIAPVWINAGEVRSDNGCDIGDTYIEVSIYNQHLWAYMNGELFMETDVVTGNTGNHDTPRGVYRILNKAQNTYLVGEDYRSFVNYWMAINWTGIGLHDATWRGSFGGSIYTYSGSHGCVNLPLWAAENIYYNFSTGTPVVIW